MSEHGPLTKKVLDLPGHGEAIGGHREDARRLGSADECQFIAVDGFEQIGPFLDVQDFAQYTEMVNGWAQYTQAFETTVRRVDELAHRVYFEVEERHQINDTQTRRQLVEHLQFDEDEKIRHLDVFLQQAPPTG